MESVRTPGAWRAALIDVTETAPLERELSETRKLEAIGTLASGVAHEFNNRLMAIAGSAEMAIKHSNGTTTRARPINSSRKRRYARRSVTAQLLTFGRGRSRRERDRRGRRRAAPLLRRPGR